MLLFPLLVLNDPDLVKHISGESRFLYYSNVALSIKHCVQRKIKKETEKKKKRRNVRISVNEIINRFDLFRLL